MSDTESFGGSFNPATPTAFTPAQQTEVAPAPQLAPPDVGTLPPAADSGGLFGSGVGKGFLGPSYTPPNPKSSALDQTADTLTQRIKRANDIATNPMLQVFAPEGVAAARNFIPAATEQLQKIRVQKADIAAGRQQAESLGLAPGEVADEATQQDRVEAAVNGALKGDLNKFKGLQTVDPTRAAAIADQVYEVTAKHFDSAKLAFDSLSGMQNQGQYAAKLDQLRKDGTLTDLEALGLKVPPNFDAFTTARPREAQALRDAQIGIQTVRQKLEERNTYQNMEEKEAKTYNNALTTAVGGLPVDNGRWARNAAAGTRGFIVNGAADPRDLGKNFTVVKPETMKPVVDAFDKAVPKEDLEKNRAFNRTYELATKDAKGNPMPEGRMNTNPNVQQAVSEGLASMLRGGSGGANVGLLKIETSKRGAVQGMIDSIVTNYAGALNFLSEKDVRPYLIKLTQSQQRDVLDVLKGYNDAAVGSRVTRAAETAGAAGYDASLFGLGKGENTVVDEAVERGRQAQIARMLPNHQAIGGGDGVLQLNAQRPGAGATGTPQGAGPNTTQLPGAQPLATPVQQSQNPPQPGSPSPGGAPPANGPTQPTAGGSNQPQPMTIAGQTVNVPPIPGASPQYLEKVQGVETPGQKNPWTATTGRGPDGKMLSSAGGAFQAIDSTWAANKPAGAPDKAKDATPQQQAEAAATLAAKNSATLSKLNLPVNDTTLYMAHNVGAGGASALLSANPGADARDIIEKVSGKDAARNNPTFFKGRPTVATVLDRYAAKMGDGATAGGATGSYEETPGVLTRVSRALMQGVPGGDAEKDAAVRRVGDAAVEHAPVIGSTAGAVLGSAAGPIGSVAGGAAGGGAGQSLKDYLQGRTQNPKEIIKQAALGGVFGVASEARPVIAAASRIAGAAAVEGGAKAAEGGNGPDIADAAVSGAAAGAGGELFGRALGMTGHKIFSMFTTDAQKTVRTAAKDLHEANEVLKKEQPTLSGAEGKSVPNPAYEAAQATKDKAEATIKEVLPNAKPDEVAYAHKVTADAVPTQEAQVNRPGTLEQQRVGAEYNALGTELDATNRRVPKTEKSTKNESMQELFGTHPTPADKLPDGPIAAVEGKKVSQLHAELAQRAEADIKAPAASWSEKWQQLADVRSQLLQAERDAISSTSMGRTKAAQDMRALADTVRDQQKKIAEYVFGKQDGKAFVERLGVLDVRYRNLMEATNGGDLVKAAALKGEAGRDAEKKFVAFAHDDPQAIAAFRAMRGVRGNLAEATVPWTVAAEGVPVIGRVVKLAKLSSIITEWARERAAGSPIKFKDLVDATEGSRAAGRAVRNLTGSVAQRVAVQNGMSPEFMSPANAGDLVMHPIMNNPAAAAQAVVNQVKSGVHGSLPGDASNRTNVLPIRPNK